MSKDEPAFPLYVPSDGIEKGMTLRDYFAAKALQSIIRSSISWNDKDQSKRAYKYADAMLAERSK